MDAHEYLTVNLLGTVRRAIRNGRQFIVAPVSMIAPGVLNGSRGPVLYTREENSKSVPLWNSIPLTVGHPRNNEGEFISAQSPSVTHLGQVFNAGSNGKLTAEAWFDEDTTRRHAPEILNRLSRNEPIELSTGLGLDLDKVPEGTKTFEGEEYRAVARNYRPDHLAILLDEQGACSIQDGCGVLVNQETGEPISNTDGGMSHEQLREELTRVLQSKFTQNEPMAFIEEVFNDLFVFRMGEDLMQQGFEMTENGPKFKGKRKKVMRKTELVPVDNRATDNSNNKSGNPPTFNRVKGVSMDPLTQDQKKQMVDFIVTNCDCWNDNDEDRKTLNEFNDEKLTGWQDRAKKEADRLAVQNAAQQGAVELGSTISSVTRNANSGTQGVATATSPSTAPKITSEEIRNAIGQLSEEDFLKMAPQTVRNQLAVSQKLIDAEKTRLVDRLVANNQDLSDEDRTKAREYLLNQDLEQLRFHANLLPQRHEEQHTGPPILNFLGNGAPADAPTPKPTDHLIAPDVDYAAIANQAG